MIHNKTAYYGVDFEVPIFGTRVCSAKVFAPLKIDLVCLEECCALLCTMRGARVARLNPL